jgi:competence protein ComEA
MGEWLERPRVYVVFGLILVAVTGGLAFWTRRPQPAPIRISTPVPTATPSPGPTPTPAPLRVYVTGAVRDPDVYVLPPASIVKDAIAAAGGPTDDADLERINLAVEVSDQQQIYVPHKGEGSLPIALPGERSPPGLSVTPETGVININTASVEALDALPGVGPAIARRIVDYRSEHGPFATIEDIMNVKGIGPATFDKMKDEISTE